MYKDIQFLKRNSLLYNFLLRRSILRNLNHQADELILRRISDLAYFAWTNHCGFFIDGRIENIILEIGRKIKGARNNVAPVIARITGHQKLGRARRNVIIATAVGKVGGHTRVISDLVRRNKLDAQTLLLTDHSGAIPDELARHADNGKLRIIHLRNDNSLIDRALIVREISRSFDRVLLSTHPHDVIPVLAFATKSTAPVIVENHAHYFFWLGTSVADVVFSHWPYMNEVTRRRRLVNKTFVWPMVIIDEKFQSFKGIEREEAKKRIGLSPDCLCILSMGTSEKFLPNRQYNFFSTAKKIIRKYPNVWIIIIGAYPDEVLAKKYLGQNPERIKLLGIIERPVIYYKAADIFMESFPLSSGGAVQEAIYYGDACPLYAYGRNRGILNSRQVYNEGVLDRIIPEASTEEEYLEYLDELIRNPGLRRKIAEGLKAEMIQIWRNYDNYRKKLFERVDNVEHSPHTIRDGVVEFQADDVNIAGLSQHKTVGEVMSYFQGSSLQLSTIEMLKIAFLLIRKGVFVQEAGMLLLSGGLNRFKAFLGNIGK